MPFDNVPEDQRQNLQQRTYDSIELIAILTDYSINNNVQFKPLLTKFCMPIRKVYVEAFLYDSL